MEFLLIILFFLRRFALSAFCVPCDRSILLLLLLLLPCSDQKGMSLLLQILATDFPDFVDCDEDCANLLTVVSWSVVIAVTFCKTLVWRLISLVVNNRWGISRWNSIVIAHDFLLINLNRSFTNWKKGGTSSHLSPQWIGIRLYVSTWGDQVTSYHNEWPNRMRGRRELLCVIIARNTKVTRQWSPVLLWPRARFVESSLNSAGSVILVRMFWNLNQRDLSIICQMKRSQIDDRDKWIGAKADHCLICWD